MMDQQQTINKMLLLLLLLIPLASAADTCSVVFGCGDSQHCFGMRAVDGSDNTGGVAPATICVSVVDDYSLEATVTTIPGWTVTRSNLWFGEDLGDVPKLSSGGYDWQAFPHEYCDSGGHTEIVNTIELMKKAEVPTNDGIEFVRLLVAHAQVTDLSTDTKHSVFAYQHHGEYAELELKSACPDENNANARALRGGNQ